MTTIDKLNELYYEQVFNLYSNYPSMALYVAYELGNETQSNVAEYILKKRNNFFKLSI